MLKLKFANDLKIQLLNDNLYDYAFKKSFENYTELNGKNIKIDRLRQAFSYTYTEQGILFWEQKQCEYENAEFIEIGHEDMVKEKWYCDVDDIDEMVLLQFAYYDKNYIYFKVTPGEQEYFNLDSNGYVKINNQLKFYSYEFKK